jgi:hypothetical protein
MVMLIPIYIIVGKRHQVDTVTGMGEAHAVLVKIRCPKELQVEVVRIRTVGDLGGDERRHYYRTGGRIDEGQAHVSFSFGLSRADAAAEPSALAAPQAQSNSRPCLLDCGAQRPATKPIARICSGSACAPATGPTSSLGAEFS